MALQKTKEPTAFLREEYANLVANSLDWKLRVLMGPSGPRCVVDGREVIMLCANNYLNLANHPRLKQAASKAIETHGVGSGSVRPIAGTMDLHMELEEKLARFKRTEAALFYQSGFATNSGLIPQLALEGDLIISDELNHGSIIDGVRLSKAEKAVYKHGDSSDLERVLAEASTKNYAHTLIVTDGVFSMDGDIAPVNEVVKLADEYGAMTYVDDAHGDGVLGDEGRGIGAHFHLEGKITVEMGTFSKAFGVVGGYISGSQDLVNFAYNKSRTWLLSASHPPPVVAACIAALEVLETEPQHVQNLWKNTNYFKQRLSELGFDIGKSQTPITPVMVYQSELARQMSEKLFESGVFALPIVYPMVAREKARIRTIMNAGLMREDLDTAVGAFEKVGKELQVI